MLYYKTKLNMCSTNDSTQNSNQKQHTDREGNKRIVTEIMNLKLTGDKT